MASLGNILIVRFSSIGDIVLASPLIRCLKKAFPESRIDFLVKSEFAELVRHNPHLSSVVEFRGPGRHDLAALREFIRGRRYDALFDIHNSNRSRYLRAFSGIRHVRVVNKRVIARFMLVQFKRSFYPQTAPSVAERYLETAAGFGVRDDGLGLEVFVPGDLSTAVSVMLSRYHLDTYRHVVGIVPGAKHATKRWLPERFVELGIALTAAKEIKLLFFGGEGEEEACGDIVQMINSRAGRTAAESLAGKFSLLETAAAFDACQVIVANDTGLMHLAAARKRKVVGIFGSTVREFGFFPFGVEHIVVERDDVACRPCSHIGLDACPRGHFRCMKEIGAAEVYDAVQTLLKGEREKSLAAHG